MTPAELDAIERSWKHRPCGCQVCCAPTDAQVAIAALIAEVRRLQAFKAYVLDDMQIDNGGRDDSTRDLIRESVAFFFDDYNRGR